MTKWTLEQKQAILESGKNIIVSAGAGSGKTAVLSERVLEKLKQNIHINELLVLTFTNAAAGEMKERIKNKILNDASLKEELALLDSAYITTFDSFALAVVRKYHYILNITKQVSICDEALLEITLNEVLDEVMDEFYLESDEKFLKLMEDLCLKDDKVLKKTIINIYKNISLKYDPISYLDKIEDYFDDSHIDNYINSYINIIKENINVIKDILKELELVFDSSFMDKLYSELNNLLKSSTYQDIKNSLAITLPKVPKNTPDAAKELKNKISSLIKDIKSYTIYDSPNSMKEEILKTFANTLVIRDILKRLFLKFEEYKTENDLYDFNDVFHLAIKIVKEHAEVKEELKSSFKEILIDEYQDTNDLQELFISLIENNNVYMVGDIKQSIYRFRNANPYIFKEKYTKYSKKDGGIKIDLNKNFRSRREVLENINTIFNQIMSDEFGGAAYQDSHQMEFGNNTYECEGKTKQEYNLEIKTYEEKQEFDNATQEAFIIGRDIKEKITSKFQVYKPGSIKTEDIKYSDFAILLDRSKDFALYKKVLDYLEIPSTIIKDEELTGEDDILVLKNIFKLIYLIHKKTINIDFRYAFLSIGRSFLFQLSDEELFSYFVNGNFDESKIYLKCLKISNNLEEKTPYTILDEIIEEFAYEEKLMTLIDIKQKRVRLEYIANFIKNMSDMGKTLDEIIDYLDVVFEKSLRINFKAQEENSNAVLIMTIHKSKGLEFPVCYFSGFTKKFNFQEIKDKIIYNNNYGLVLPAVGDFIKPTIIKELVKQDSKKEEISEKIRLLYVALTRAKENMIIVCPSFIEENNNVSYDSQMKYQSFYDILKSISGYIDSYIKQVESKATNDYLNTNLNNILENSTATEFTVENINISKEEIKEDKFSKHTVTLQTKNDFQKMSIGTKFHQMLEMLDFKNPILTHFNEEEKTLIKNFLNQDLIKENIDAKFYHEYEFLDQNEKTLYHGIIDLLIEKENEIIIIDYKLKNIEDDAYKKQLNGYKDVISKKTNKKVQTYLYSILDNYFKKV